MSLSTSNKFGKISISEEAMQTVASHAAQDCYGVVDLVSRRFSDNIGQLLGKINSAKVRSFRRWTISSTSSFLSC